MRKERGFIYDYYAHTLPGQAEVSVIDLAAQPHVGFNPEILPRDSHDDIERRVLDDVLFVSRNRNHMGANVDLHITSLKVPIDELKKPTAQPTSVKMQSKAVLWSLDRQFSGYTECEFLYWRCGFDDRLQQSVTITKMPPQISPILASVSIERRVLEKYGDMTYGSVIFNAPDVTDRLGVRLENGDPIFLAFTPQVVLATTYGPGPNVLEELSYEAIEEAGIKATFTNEAEQATFSIAVGSMTLRLQLGKILKPDYPRLMFDRKEEWITHGEILIARLPQQILN